MARAVATAVFACASGYVGEGQHGGAVLVENGFVTLRNCRAYNNVATLDVRRHQQTFFGTTVGFGNDQILGNVYQTASQVT